MKAAPAPLDAQRVQQLRPALNGLYHSFDYEARLSKDPLGLVRGFERPEDQEIAGLVSAALAYGRVDLFLPRLRALFTFMATWGGPEAFVRGYSQSRGAPFLQGFRYRVTSGDDLNRLFIGLAAALERHGSLQSAFETHFSSDHEDIGQALAGFVAEVQLQSDRVGPASRSFKHLLPSPSGGSACKRLNLWLRWMVRQQPGVDLGIWRRIPPSHLVIPLDTHSLRMAFNLGLTERQDMSWRNARLVTQRLRQLDPADPVKYDFALCHLGMSGDCPARRSVEICSSCGQQGLCRWW